MRTRLRIPEPDRLIVRSRRERRAVWREGDGPDPVAVAFERLEAGVPNVSDTRYSLDELKLVLPKFAILSPFLSDKIRAQRHRSVRVRIR